MNAQDDFSRTADSSGRLQLLEIEMFLKVSKVEPLPTRDGHLRLF